MTDNELDELVQPIINYYSLMEQELMVEVARRFAAYDGEITGTLDWQLQRLAELGAVNQALVKIIKKYSGMAESKIESVLRDAGYANIEFDVLEAAYEAGEIAVNPEVLRQSERINEIIELSHKTLKENTFSLIDTKALESAKQQYLNIINTAYLNTATGTYSLDESVKRAVAQMSQQGITAATYKRGNKIIHYSVEGAVRRDVRSATNKLANDSAIESCKELNIDYVEISQHLGARVHATNPIANHAGWQGKAYKIHGSEKGYPNLKENTGYPDDILGLAGVNCRHRMFLHIPGTPLSHSPIDENENKKAYEATQRQRKLERDIRSLKKQLACANAVGDTDRAQMLRYKLDRKYDEIDAHCKANNLRRDYSRELVAEQIENRDALKVKSLEKSAKSDIINTTTANGITITDISKHTFDRISQRGVSIKQIKDAVTEPLHITDIKTDDLGRKSQEFIGKGTTVAVNPDTGNITTVWKTGKRTLKKYGEV